MEWNENNSYRHSELAARGEANIERNKKEKCKNRANKMEWNKTKQNKIKQNKKSINNKVRQNLKRIILFIRICSYVCTYVLLCGWRCVCVRVFVKDKRYEYTCLTGVVTEREGLYTRKTTRKTNKQINKLNSRAKEEKRSNYTHIHCAGVHWLSLLFK